MKMAKASDTDLDMAMKLVNYLDSIERRQMPDDLSKDDESIEWLDYRDTDQYAKLIDGLCRLLNQGSISRVVFGMYVVCDPANKCLDPDADTLEIHPELEKAAEQRDELLRVADGINARRKLRGFLVPQDAEDILAAIAKAEAAMSKDNGGPAFPIHPDMPTPNDHGDPTGMALRDYFAAKAMQGLIAQSCGTAASSSVSFGAEYAYQMADAMMKARKS